MKKKIIILFMIAALLVSAAPFEIYAASYIDNAEVYYTPSEDYTSGDCILSATKSMIRRACILRGAEDWDQVTNDALRSRATIFGLLLHSFTFDACGFSFSVKSSTFKGSTEAERITEIAALLSQHPEGIVVHGTNAATTGTHGVLVTSVENGIVYAADSTNNMGSRNMGIQSWSDTTMKSIKKVTRYWYIESVGPGGYVELTSNLKIKSYNRPKTVKKNKGFNIRGTVKSNRVITNVTVQITDLDGNVLYEGTASPNKKSYKISRLRKKLKFKKLAKGKYYYNVTATDTVKTKTLLHKKFTKK